MEAGQITDPSKTKMNQYLGPVARNHQKAFNYLPPGMACRQSGYALPPSAHPRHTLILIDADLSP